MDRRQLLSGLTAATVLGFNPLARTWVSVAQASTPFEHVPQLDGVLVTDPASLATDGVDAGNIIHETPVAVLRPGSVRDIQKMIRFCRRFRIRVAARGQGHTTFGQAQARGGLVIEMSTLNQIHSLEADRADVDAGLKWKDLLLASVAQGLTPPVLTGFTGLSIGGTLSVGGISPTYNQGAQIDNVRELEIVTGEGSIERCSEYHHRDLFEAALGGLGQCGIITRAVVDIVPAQPMARTILLNYVDNAAFFRDFRVLLNRGEFHDLSNIWVPNGQGGWIYQLNAIQFFDPAHPPDNDFLLRGLSVDPANAQFSDGTYLDYILRVDFLIDLLRQIGLWDNVLHPWFDVFLGDYAIERYVGDVIPTITPDDVGATGLMLLFPQKTSKLTRPFFRVPESCDWIFLFDILTAAQAPGPNPDFQERMLRRNSILFEKARRTGGTRYPIGAIEFNHLDWIRHYGDQWPRFERLKRRFDPDGILTPGPGIFAPC